MIGKGQEVLKEIKDKTQKGEMMRLWLSISIDIHASFQEIAKTKSFVECENK